MVNAQGRSSARSSGITVGDDLHRETIGDGGTLGDTEAYFSGVCRIEGKRGGGCMRITWWSQEASETQLWSTLDEISWKSNRRRWGERDTH